MLFSSSLDAVTLTTGRLTKRFCLSENKIDSVIKKKYWRDMIACVKVVNW
jgi:hypothetical protein